MEIRSIFASQNRTWVKTTKLCTKEGKLCTTSFANPAVRINISSAQEFMADPVTGRTLTALILLKPQSYFLRRAWKWKLHSLASFALSQQVEGKGQLQTMKTYLQTGCGFRGSVCICCSTRKLQKGSARFKEQATAGFPPEAALPRPLVKG